jgi:hypothetical protein
VSAGKIALVLGCLVALGQTAFAESPREFAHRFYSLWRHWEIRGVPEPKESGLIAPYVSSELLKIFAEVDRQSAGDARLHPWDPKHPEDAIKGIWSKEGDLITGGYEGYTTFAIGRVTRVHHRVAVEVHLEWYVSMGKIYPWTDTVVLDRAGDGWVVADVVFADGDSMVVNLKKELAENGKYLRGARIKSTTRD